MIVFTLLAFIECKIPLYPNRKPFHFESFQAEDWATQWQVTSLPNYTGSWQHRSAKMPQSIPGEKMIFMSSESSFYGLSTKFPKPLDLKGEKTLVLQYEVRFEGKLECGGAYIKLFSRDENPHFSTATLSNETRYVIMFGPDKCGDTDKVHFIFRHLEPNGEFEEKHMNNPPMVKDDNLNHLYTLIVRPDNTFEILIDGVSEKNGNLFTDFTPSVNPPKEIDDPTDIKPDDWVDEEMMDDPDAKKPDDWDENEPEYIPDPEQLEAPEGWLVDEPRFIQDPNSEQPDDWDSDIHGDWEPTTIANPKCEIAPGCGEYEPPLIENPKYVGKWNAPQIENPNYKGEWKARQIQNPNYYEDPNPHTFRPFIGAGFEVWMVDKDIGFSNVYIGTDENAVKEWNDQHFIPKHALQESDKKSSEPESSTSDSTSNEGSSQTIDMKSMNVDDLKDSNYKNNNNKANKKGKSLYSSDESFFQNLLVFLKQLAELCKQASEGFGEEMVSKGIALINIGMIVFVLVSLVYTIAFRIPADQKKQKILLAKRKAKKAKEEQRLLKLLEEEEKRKAEKGEKGNDDDETDEEEEDD